MLSSVVSNDSASKRELLARSVSCLYSTSLSNFRAIVFAGAVVNTIVPDCLFAAILTVWA